jgi:hypothetical protein
MSVSGRVYAHTLTYIEGTCTDQSNIHRNAKLDIGQSCTRIELRFSRCVLLVTMRIEF